MSFHTAPSPECTGAEGVVDLVIEPKAKELGGLSVRRVLPAPEKRSVGPFVFFDEMGPAEFPPGVGIQVRPHPHIGLATVTYLFEGEIMHRDSLGFVQPIQPGAVNLMTAGRGIVHSERAGDDLDRTARLHGIQTWLALPEGKQEIDPAFVHHPAETIPGVDVDGVAVRVIIGEAFGARSPVEVQSRTLYLELRMPAGSAITLPGDAGELACYLVSGRLACSERGLAPGRMAILASNAAVELQAEEDCHVMVAGGEPLGQRHMYWNFVSTSRERIEQAKEDWREGRFGGVPGDDEFIPLPG